MFTAEDGKNYKLKAIMASDSDEASVVYSISGERVSTPYQGIGSNKIFTYGGSQYYNDGEKTWKVEVTTDAATDWKNKGGTGDNIAAVPDAGATETPKSYTATRGEANYVKNTWFDRGLVKGDQFRAEVGGKNYDLRSDGEGTDLGILDAAKAVSNTELFTVGGEDVYLKLGGKVYAVKGINEKTFAKKINSEAERFASEERTAVGAGVTVDASIFKAGNKTSIFDENERKYNFKILSSQGQDSPAYKAAKNIEENELFTFGDHVYVKVHRDDFNGVFELGATGSSSFDMDNLKDLREYASKGYLEKNVKRGNVLSYDDFVGGQTINCYDAQGGLHKAKVEERAVSGNSAVHKAAESFGENEVFAYNDTLYIKKTLRPGKGGYTVYKLKTEWASNLMKAVKNGTVNESGIRFTGKSVPKTVTSGMNIELRVEGQDHPITEKQTKANIESTSDKSIKIGTEQFDLATFSKKMGKIAKEESEKIGGGEIESGEIFYYNDVPYVYYVDKDGNSYAAQIRVKNRADLEKALENPELSLYTKNLR